LFVAEQVRELMASLGVATIDDLVGRSDLLRAGGRRSGLDLGALIAPAIGPRGVAHRRCERQDHGLEGALDHSLIAAAEPALAGRGPAVVGCRVANTDRSVGAMLGGAIARRGAALAAGGVTVLAEGTGGQSFGAFMPLGMTLSLTGWCNDYAGKGLSGGTLAIRPPEGAGLAAAQGVVVGNT